MQIKEYVDISASHLGLYFILETPQLWEEV